MEKLFLYGVVKIRLKMGINTTYYILRATMCDELIKNKEKYFADDSLTYEGSSVSKCSLSVETLSPGLSRLTHL